MRFINQERLWPLIREFKAELDEAATAVLAETDPKRRKALIDDRAPAWRILRDAMKSVSHGKCWYTESKNPGTDDDVDHYRPKNRVAENSAHPGYYWLAFDWKNYRLSCHHSNRLRRSPGAPVSGGKGAHFPLVDETQRAFAPDQDWHSESPIFLDPCNPEDPAILSFWPNGESAVSPEYSQDVVANRRWQASRLALHIDWPDFVDARLELYNRVERLVDRGSRERPAASLSSSEAFTDVVRDLLELMEPSSDFSRAARIYVESFSHVWWVERIVLRV